MDDLAKANKMREGIAAAQAGEREQAYQIFSQIVEDDYNNENAWIWLSATAADPDEALAAAGNALAINPNNEFAQQAEKLALQAKEERTASQQLSTHEALTDTAAQATATQSQVTVPTDDSLLPPWLAQDMATKGASEATTEVATPVIVPTGRLADEQPASLATRPARPSFDSRLESRTTVKGEQEDTSAIGRRQSLLTAGIVVGGLAVVALVGYLLFNAFGNKPSPQSFTGASPTPTPTLAIPSPTLPAVLRVTQTAVAVEQANATATARVLAVTATAGAKADANAQATAAAQTFPTATPGPALFAYNRGLDAYNHHQYAEAAAALEQAVQLDRTLVLGHYYLGQSDLQLAQAPLGTAPITATVAPLTSTASTTPTVSLSPTPTSAEYYEKAAFAFRNVTSLAPTWAGGYAGLADTYLRQSRYPEALPPAQQAVTLDDGRPEYWLLLGRIYDGLGRSNDAKTAYDRADSLKPPVAGSTPPAFNTLAPTTPTAVPTSLPNLAATATPIQLATNPPLAPTNTPAPPPPTLTPAINIIISIPSPTP